ncbi:MAG: 23S rRNA pseudouridine(2604) synthase RluF [Candidatus Izimaplasma sp.]|nr:23S rRNA pseudouridine(2604) synthase RluF [Candidatus Izimaplasma bacterium]
METRINKYLSEAGFCSRREADRLIDSNRITVNDELPEKGRKVTEKDIVRVDGNIIERIIEPIYIALNKPVGIVSTTDPTIENNIVDFLNHPKRLFHVGRLDKPSEGLIFMTNDGDIVNKILRAGNYHEKEYIVKVHKEITDYFIDKMSNGIPIMGIVTKKCKIEKLNNFEFKITLVEGLNRQIRKMCDYLGYKVYKLKRIRIMNVKLDIPTGKWRYLTEEEILGLNRLIETSVKTEEASI